LTEKLLLVGGAIQLAGEVKARGERRQVRSDCMAVERKRGISVSSAALSFERQGLPSTCSTRRATRISVRRANAIRAFILCRIL
jgi:translation elongation factor EF-G